MAETPDTRLLSETNGRTLFPVRGEAYQDIRSHGAKCDGVTDDLDAFTKAFAAGSRVFVPAGVTRVRSAVLVPSNKELFGAGMDLSTIRLTDAAPRETWVVTNSTRTIGNTNITVRDMTLDWNVTRQGGLTAAGGSRSSCLTFGYVTNSNVSRVRAINGGLHGFDVTYGPLDYPYGGDGVLAGTRSSNIRFFQCEATNFGDDAFTTHSSDDVWFTECYGYDPRLRDNCNAFEVDGDSRRVTLTSNRSKGCYAGIEIKGHGSESAAQDVIINGHRDEGSVRSYNWRHIGYHSGSNPVSKTAKNIIATNLVSINPSNAKGFQDDATPRALSISAYRGVSVTGFTVIGNNTYTAGAVAVAVQFRAANINITGLNIRGWGGADQDVSVTTGDNVSLSGVTIEGSSSRAVYFGATVTGANLFGLNATAPATGAVIGVDIYTTSGVDVGGMSITGYPTAVRGDSVDFPTVKSYMRRTLGAPEGTTRLIDLDPTRDYYIPASSFDTMTDRPNDHVGGNFITHSRLNGDSMVQTLTRSTAVGSLQIQTWRVVNFQVKTAGPWNRAAITQVASVA